MKFTKLLASLATSFLLISPAFSQGTEDNKLYEYDASDNSLIIGITFGYGRVFHTEGIAHPMDNVPNGSDQPHLHPAMDPAQTNAFFFGGFLELFLPNRTTSIAIRTFYNDMARATAFVSGQPYKVVDMEGKPVSTEVRHSSDFTASFIHGEVVAHQAIFDNFSLGFGVGAGFPQEGKIVKKFELLSPPQAAFERDPRADSMGLVYSDDNRTIFIKNNDVVNTHYYAKLGARYNWSITNIIITPSIFYNFGLNTATQQQDFKMNTLQIGMDIGFGL
jgi:hypothetical protein